jgi:hypothetical protein
VGFKAMLGGEVFIDSFSMIHFSFFKARIFESRIELGVKVLLFECLSLSSPTKIGIKRSFSVSN